MVLVNSRKTIWLLTRRFLKINRGRNIIAVLAVIMTAVMFTASFTAAVSVLRSTMNQEMRTSMDSSQISVQDLTEEQFRQISQYDKIKEMGYTIFLSVAENEELQTISTEIRYADENGARSYQCLPTQGTLPQGEKEAAVSTIVLDLLGVPHEIGSTVTLTYSASGKQITEDFRLSGFWEGDPLPRGQMVWISRDYCLAHMKTATEESIAMGDFEGDYNLSLWFDNIFKLNQYKEEIEELYHVSDTPARMDIPPAYDRLFGEDGFPFATVGAVVFLVFLSGYLIIYNVFQISVKNDIRAYGLLKNIGTTGRQLKGIVRRQALLLSGIGIPIGLLLGWLAGRAMVPYLLESDLGAESTEVLVSTSPWIFLTAVLFSLATVYIACMRPCHIVAKVSPVEAVRMTEGSARNRERKGHKVTPGIMALENMKRTWKKSVLVVLSLTLPIFLLNCIYTIQKGFDFDIYIDTYISSDFKITGSGTMAQYADLNALTPEILEDIRSQEGIESMACVYDTEELHLLSEKEYKILENMMGLAEKEKIYDSAWAKEERKRLESRQIPSHVLGINQGAFEKMGFLDSSFTWQEFIQGDYVIVSASIDGFGGYSEPGDTVTLELGGQKREFQVLGVGAVPYDLEYPFGAGTYYDISFYLPEETYLQMGGNPGAMTVGIEAEEGEEKALGKWLEDYLADKPQLLMDSRMELEQQCSRFAGKYMLILGLLCGVLFVIGVLNFFNTSAVSVISRKKELSLLEAVGMTRKQVLRMLCTEGGIYFLAALLLADTAGIPLMRAVIAKTAGRSFFFTYHPSIAVSLLAIPLLALIAWGVPRYHYRKMCRETVVERIREE